ncbi:MAG: hypothetical protein WCE53_15140 [Candidatus Acidiferrum sp.]
MNKHPYLRAYLAGIAVPTVFLLLVMTGYTVIRYVYAVPIPIERVIVFPMAAVPNAWGLWNVLYRAFNASRRVSLGVFGGALPLLLAPGGYVVTRLLAFTVPHEVFAVAPFAFPVGLIVYYLVWKYFVGFLNAELGIA